jgi:hypothetical protein
MIMPNKSGWWWKWDRDDKCWNILKVYLIGDRFRYEDNGYHYDCNPGKWVKVMNPDEIDDEIASFQPNE